MKWYLLAFCLAVFSATAHAQDADPCTGLVGAALGQCQGDQQKLQRQQLAQQQQQLAQQQQQLMQQQQQLTQQQQQLAQQQQQLMRQQQQLQQQQGQTQINDRPQNQQQLDDMQHQIELLKSANQRPTPAAIEAKRQELQSWKAENPWYGTEYTKTQFAMRYAKELQREQPDLVGRPFLDAISAKVTDTFGANK